MSRCNDIVNAICNSCKHLVRASDGSLLLLNKEGGDTPEELNADSVGCAEVVNGEMVETLPRIFTNKFREDMMTSLYTAAVPAHHLQQKPADPHAAFARSIIPGLKRLRCTLSQMMAQEQLDDVLPAEISAFFDDHLCTSPLCLRQKFGKGIPLLNVSHPPWFYLPKDTPDYLYKCAGYIQSFLKTPVSSRCGLCDIYSSVCDSVTPINLFGLPEQFSVNSTICSLYSRHEVVSAEGLPTLRFNKVADTNEYVVQFHGTIYY